MTLSASKSRLECATPLSGIPNGRCAVPRPCPRHLAYRSRACVPLLRARGRFHGLVRLLPRAHPGGENQCPGRLTCRSTRTSRVRGFVASTGGRKLDSSGGHDRDPCSPISLLGPSYAEQKGVRDEIYPVRCIHCCRDLLCRHACKLGSVEWSPNDLAG